MENIVIFVCVVRGRIYIQALLRGIQIYDGLNSIATLVELPAVLWNIDLEFHWVAYRLLNMMSLDVLYERILENLYFQIRIVYQNGHGRIAAPFNRTKTRLVWILAGS